MARLYGSIDADASKTQATRRAYHNISAHIRGWNEGVEVVGYTRDDHDVFEVYATGGSNGGTRRLIFTLEDGLPVFET